MVFGLRKNFLLLCGGVGQPGESEKKKKTVRVIQNGKMNFELSCYYRSLSLFIYTSPVYNLRTLSHDFVQVPVGSRESAGRMAEFL